MNHLRQDNVRDHRAGTVDLNTGEHAQVRLRVHHIVISRYWAEAFIVARLLGGCSKAIIHPYI